MKKYTYSLFTKPWKTLPSQILAEKVRTLGFDAVEFPLRSGFQAEPEHAGRDLPKLAAIFKAEGLAITSVASDTTEEVFAACQAAEIPVIRIMAGFDISRSYLTCEDEFKRYLDTLAPLSEKYGVTVGIQNHCGPMVFNSMQLRHLVEGYDQKHIAAIWDAAHSGLAGEEPEQGLDIVWDHLCMINFKNAFWRRKNGPEAPEAIWEPYFTTGRQGMADYPRIALYMKQRGYSGTICLPAEYTDAALTDQLIPSDLSYVKSLLEAQQ
ncbi:MAG: sugar phosphate isomerase/epimerase family protein [Clostridiaceae bacterium]|nr:sugar phosphate isomerase/epimerase family protein [Clostridiaceae bacterium]